MDGVKNAVLGFAELHPYILLATSVILFILLIVAYIGVPSWGEKYTSKKRRNKDHMSDSDELAELIDSIHAKQKPGSP